MSHPNPPTPELHELQQESAALDVKGDVQVTNSVQTYDLPSRHGVSTNINLVESVATFVFGEDLRRRRAVLVAIAPTGSTSRGIYVGQKDAVAAGYAALWPYAVPLELLNTEQCYVMPDGTSLAAGHVLSVVTENWAD